MALTLPSSNGDFLFIVNDNAKCHNGQMNTHLNGGLTKTTATLTPTRLKNIEEQFIEHSLQPPKPFLHDHMAGFVPPTVSIKLHLQSQPQPIESDSTLASISDNSKTETQSKSIDYFSCNSNSDDSYSTINYISDDYSSETNSSNTNLTFTNFIQNSTMPNNQQKSMKSRSKHNINDNNNVICLSTRSMRSSQKKSTAGGRKPNQSQNLSTDELLKRQKRRERNKIAAARCRKKRVDQTNSLIDETKELQKKHEVWIKKVDNLVKELLKHKQVLLQHESQCHNMKLDIVQKILSQIDFSAINSAMEAVPEEDFDIDLNHTTCNTSSSQDELSQQAEMPPKRKRPNSLPIRPLINNQQQQLQNRQNQIEHMKTLIGTNTNDNGLVATPSNGFNFSDLGLTEPTGLTPLNPTISTVDLTPSTMTAILKSLTSPIDDQKKLLSM